jgi:hypothetical protein
MPPLGPATGLAMAAGEASIDEDVCAQLTAPSNSKSGRTRIVSRMMRLPLYSTYYSLVIACGIVCRLRSPLRNTVTISSAAYLHFSMLRPMLTRGSFRIATSAQRSRADLPASRPNHTSRAGHLACHSDGPAGMARKRST